MYSFVTPGSVTVHSQRQKDGFTDGVTELAVDNDVFHMHRGGFTTFTMLSQCCSLSSHSCWSGTEKPLRGCDHFLTLLSTADAGCLSLPLQQWEELARVPCDRSNLSSDERMELLLMLRAQSQIVGWCIIIITAIGALLGTCFTNCRSKVSYLQLTFWKRYVDKEKEHFDTFAVEYATKLAERNLQSFFENKDPDPFPFPNHKAWEEISAYYTFSRGEEYYSTLQRYVEKANRDFTPEKRPVLSFEHGIEMH
ncbi:calcium homeostasis modulator protein 5-like isoform X3 [Epinephelus lanceolatus]